MINERWVVGALLLVGFLWLRRRVRQLEGADRRRALYGIFFFLGPLLFAGKWIFDRLPYGQYRNLAIEAVSLLAIFAVTALLFLRPAGRSDSLDAVDVGDER